ncbi:MAG: LCP family protein [Streptococcaceae bacterium]|jgi:LCP family protein required for cell wall assembly|nr:LCP family protein [Streptococcaceae bacterium]
MESHLFNRLRYLRQNYDYLSDKELNELEGLEAKFRIEQQHLRNPEYNHYADEEDFSDLGIDQQQADSLNYDGGPKYSRVERHRYASEYNDDFYGDESGQGYDDEGYAEDDQSYNQSVRSRHSGPDNYSGRDRKKTAMGKSKKQKKSKYKANGKKRHHWFRNILIFLLLIIVTMIGFFVYGYQRGAKKAGEPIKAEKFNGQKTSSGAVNILILGADQRPDQTSAVAHTDSIMVLQLKPKDGKIKMVSLMRDTLVNIPGYSAEGADDLKINTAYTLGEQEKPRSGPELLRRTIESNFGVKIQYYALVDFSSFATIIDSLFPGGVEIDAQFAKIGKKVYDEVPVPDDLSAKDGLLKSDVTLSDEDAQSYGYDQGGVFMMIKQGKQKMNGRTLLNYARFRHDDENDFGRVKRQQQVMSTLMGKVKNPLTLFTGSSALGTAKALTETNIPNSFFLLNGFSTVWDAKNGTDRLTVPDLEKGDFENQYDQYAGLGLGIDINSYRSRIEQFLGN